MLYSLHSAARGIRPTWPRSSSGAKNTPSKGCRSSAPAATPRSGRQTSGELDEIDTIGLVGFHRQAGKRTHWKLSDAADWKLRRLATLADFPELLTLMLAIREHTDAGYHNGGCVADWGLACGSAHGDQWTNKERALIVEVACIAAPGLCRGWLESWSDHDGAVGYSLTDTGRRLSRRSGAADNRVAGILQRDARDLYAAALTAARESLKDAKPARPGHCAIPLSAGDWAEESEAAPIPAIFNKAGWVRHPGHMLRTIRRCQGGAT